MKKSIALIVLAAVMVFTLMACSYSSTETRTEVVTDANGHTTTTTTQITNDNGQITEKTETVEGDATETEAAEEESPEAEDEPTVATLSFQNDTGMVINAIYFAPSASDEWSENVLNTPLVDGHTRRFNDALTYYPDGVLWDLKLEYEDGGTAEFAGLDISNAADPTNITIVLTADIEAETSSALVQ